MKVAVILALGVLVVVSAYPAEDSLYDSKYDNINIDEILGNERLFKKYIDCMSNRGKCTPDGKHLKDSLPDALQTACEKCTEKQKSNADKILRFSIEHHRADYDSIAKLYDPEGEYLKKYRGEAERRGIHI